MSPQSDTATDYIAEKPLYIPFLAELFSGASMSDYEVDPRQQAPRRRVIGNKILPSMRVVKANSSLIHSGDKTKKNARTVLETASGQDVSEHNISARAHIVVNPRKARPPKTCSKPESAPHKAAHKKKAVRKRKEEDDDESPDSENDDESADEAMQELTDETIGGDANAVSTISFQIGERVRNCAGLRGIIEHSHDDLTYDIAYNDGRKDCKVQARHIKPVPAGRILLFLF